MVEVLGALEAIEGVPIQAKAVPAMAAPENVRLEMDGLLP